MMSLKYLVMSLLVVCAIAIAIVTYYCLDSSKKVSNPVSDSSSHSEPVTQQNGGVDSEDVYDTEAAISQSDFIYPKESVRDPFQQVSIPVPTPQKPPAPTGRQTSIMLTGIIWDEVEPIAIITDSKKVSHLKKNGEEIGGAKILAIQPRSITIERDGKAQELVLWPAPMDL